MRQAAKKDSNEAAIVKALRNHKAWVMCIGQPYDLLVHYHGTWRVLEVKDGSKPPSAQLLSPQQLDTLASLRLSGVVLVRNEKEALAAIGAIKWAEADV